VLVGRAAHQAGALSAALQALGAEVIEIPFIEIRPPASFTPIDAALKNIADYQWLILTSVNGVVALWKRMEKLGLSSGVLRHLKVAAIGPATKKAMEAQGVAVDIMPKEYVAESVVSSMQDLVPGKRVLLVRAKVARDVIPRELRTVGANVDVVEAYETVVPIESREKLKSLFGNSNASPHFITFTSSSSVRNFVALLGDDLRNQGHKKLPGHQIMRFASIGPVTSATLRELNLPVDIEAAEYTIPGLVAAIAKAVATKPVHT
jgi:uroporphyrinogen-III synthase